MNNENITNQVESNKNQLDLSKKLLEKHKTPSQNIPITVKSYPSPVSVNTQNPNNFHVNMNITNININQKNHPLLKNIQPLLHCDRDNKVNF